MKKFFIAAIALVMCAGNAKALDNEPEEGFTFMGLFGMNISKLQNSGYNAKLGATMGGRVDYVLPKAHGTYVTAGIDWTMKGGKFSGETDILGPTVSTSAKYNLHYFEIPIRVGFRYNVSDEIGFYGELGPYFAVGVGGKHRFSVDKDGEDANVVEDANTYKAFKKADYEPIPNPNNPYQIMEKLPFQRWDAGIGFRVGAEYNQHYNLMIGCDWGLADIYRDNLRDQYYEEHLRMVSLPKVKNFNFSITIGYRF